MLFNLYVRLLTEISRALQRIVKQYTVDTQLYISLSEPHIKVLGQYVVAAVDSLRMSKMQLSPDKMEAMLVGRAKFLVSVISPDLV